MIEIKERCFQGDMMLRRVELVPDDFAPVDAVDGRHVLAHSETGHHHDVDACGLTLYVGDNPMVCYLRMDGVEYADIIHHRDTDTHEPVRLLGGVGTTWGVFRQREYSPNGWRRVED